LDWAVDVFSDIRSDLVSWYEEEETDDGIEMVLTYGRPPWRADHKPPWLREGHTPSNKGHD
jgi:hypothetical protein